jgi:putative peptidoglycan lipid II flippase
VNAGLLYRGLKSAGVYSLPINTIVFMIKLIISAAVMAIVVYLLSSDFDVWLAMSFVEQIKNLLLCITAGMLTYLLMIIMLGIRFSDIKVIKIEK